jgi:hypothetical protein
VRACVGQPLPRGKRLTAGLLGRGCTSTFELATALRWFYSSWPCCSSLPPAMGLNSTWLAPLLGDAGG